MVFDKIKELNKYNFICYKEDVTLYSNIIDKVIGFLHKRTITVMTL